MSRLMIKDIVEQTGVQSTSTVYNWIKNGFLKAIRVGVGRNQHWEVEAEDFYTFLKSDYYPGNPEAIAKQTEMFSRVPLLENCYPYNLLTEVLGLDDDRIEDEDSTSGPDIWRVDIPAFREWITRLNDREQRVLELRYQFGLTLDESAAVLGITRERIRQIQMKALRKLRYHSVRNEFTTVPVGKYKELEEKIRHLEVENAELKQQLDKAGFHEETLREEALNTLEVPIWELDLSVRSSNCLMRAGIKTVSDILRFDANQNQRSWVNRDFPFNSWMEIRNLGIRSLQEIAKAVYRYCGYRIRTYNMTDGTWTVVPIPGRDENSQAPENSRLDWSRIQATTGDEFVFITDYHAHKNTGHSLGIINKFYEQAGISKVFCGGDIGTSTGINGIKTNAKAIKMFRDITPEFYACVGNHEWKVPDDSTPAATYNLVYNYYISQMEQHSQSMSEFGDFWIDSKGAKIRYFFLNQNTLALLTDISLKWFIQELPKVPAGYGIVVIMHHAYHSKTYNTAGSRKNLGMLNWWENVVGLRNLTVRRISQILNAVRTGTVCEYALRPYDSSIAKESNYTPRGYTSVEKASCGDYDPLLSTFAAGTNTGAYTDIVTFDGSAMNDGVYPIAIFCGHKHEDAAYDPASASSFSDMTDENTVYLMNGTWYRYDSDMESATYGQRVAMKAAAGADQLSQTETVPPILVVLTTTDCYALNHPDTDPTVRQLGTISEQAFDIVQIDTEHRKVYCTRIGAGNDRVFSF